MSRFEELPPDQRAALSLLLRQQESYAHLAAILGIEEQAVHDRAHAALAVLAPRQARALEPSERHEIGDYLLAQQMSVAERLRTRTLLSSSQAAAAWAQALTLELTVIDGAVLPEVSPDTATATASTTAVAGASATQTHARPATVAPAELGPATASGASQAPPRPSSAQPHSSRVGGALLLAAIVAAAIVVVIVVSSGGGSRARTPASVASGAPGASPASGPREQARFTLKGTGASSSVGAVQILSEGTKRAFYIQAEHLPATHNFFYAIWLYNSPSSALPLSKSPPVGASHKLAGAAALPEDAASYREILLTRETSTHPTHPGHVVLRGTFKLTG